MKKFFQDFKAFAMKGNIMDMAVGVVVGGAFGKIVTSLVNDIITPLIAFITGNVALTDLKWIITEGVMEGETIIQPEVAVMYGNFLQTVIDFLIIAFSIFCVLRLMMNAQKKLEALSKKKQEEEAAAEEVATETELTLLQEIRDLLKDKEEK